MKHVVSSFVCCGVALAAGIASADGDLEKLVDETYRRLTDEERIAQISGVTAGVLVDENGNFDAKKAAKRFPHGFARRAAFFAVASEEEL